MSKRQIVPGCANRDILSRKKRLTIKPCSLARLFRFLACKSRSLVSLARMLGGSLLAHKAQHFHPSESVLFDVIIAVELQQMHAKDLSTTVERLTGVIGPKLAGDRASLHINVKPAADKLDLQQSLCFLDREAA